MPEIARGPRGMIQRAGGSGGRDIFTRVRELHRSPFFLLTIDDEQRLIRRTRTERGFSSLEEARGAYDAMLGTLDPINKAPYALLVDMRAAPSRNDPAFEQLVRPYYPRLYHGFRRIAALVKTQAGRLQLMRMVQKYDPSVGVFLDESEALAHLETKSSTRRAR